MACQSALACGIEVAYLAREESRDVPRVQALAVLLRQQSEMIGRLLTVARSKRDAILAQDHVKVQEAVAEEAELLKHVHDLEERRARWVAKWQERNCQGEALREAIHEDVPTLRDVLNDLPEKEAKELRAAADTLSRRVSELDDINRQNAGLLYHSLAYVQAMLSMLTDAGARGKIYGPRTRPEREAGGRAILDWRA